MDKEKRKEFYEKRYFHELDMREKIESRLRGPLTMIIVSFGTFAFLEKRVFAGGFLDKDYPLLLSFLSGVFFWVCALYFFMRTIRGYHYSLLPTPKVLEEYFEKILIEGRKSDRGQSKKWAEEDFSEYLFKNYVVSTTQNTLNNDAKSLNIDRSIKSIFCAFCFSGLTYFLHRAFS